MSSEQPTHHGYAVNVKDHALYNVERGSLTDEQVGDIYQACAEGFWEDAQEVAQGFGFEAIYSEGRSGGWAVPSPQPNDDDWEEDELAEWIDDRFRPLERTLRALMRDYREGFLVRLAFEVDRANVEPAERAYWEARDVITI